LARGVDHHLLCHRSSAGGNRGVFAFNLHETKAAGGKRLFPCSDSAKVGDVDAVIQSCPQDFFTRGSPYFLAVNRQRDFLDFRQYSLLMLPPGPRIS
jgi:hypothetical protein